MSLAQCFSKPAKLIVFLLATYLVILSLLFILQKKLLYFPTTFTAGQQTKLINQLQYRQWPVKGEMRGITSNQSPIDPKGTFLVFHGNAGTALNSTSYIKPLEQFGYRVIVLEYPGYGARPGDISEKELIADGIVSAKLAISASTGGVTPSRPLS